MRTIVNPEDSSALVSSTIRSELQALETEIASTTLGHDHDGTDSKTVSHTLLSDKGTNTHPQIDTAVSASTAHIADTAEHGATGAVVGTTNIQTLTNKTLTSPKINEDVAVTASATEINVLDGIPSTLTATELGYVDGVTSSIQTQLDGKIAKTTNITALNETGIADGEIAVFNLTNKDIRTSDKTIVTSLGADDTTIPTSKAVKDVTDVKLPVTKVAVSTAVMTELAAGFTLEGGTTKKTLTVPLDASVSGTNTGDQTLPTRDSLGLDTDDTVTFANLSGTNTGDNPGVTSVSGTAPVVSSGGATPVISIAAATASVDGYATATQITKLDGIEALADVTDATNVDAAGATMNADTTLAGNGWFLDTDAMTENDATKTCSQQSIKAYADTKSPGYALQAVCPNFAPADSTTYYFGMSASAPATAGRYSSIYIPSTGIIKNIYCNLSNGIVGTNEATSFYIRVNNSTDTLISDAITLNAAFGSFSKTDLSLSVSAGDYIEIKMVCPAWATNPQGVRISATLFIEKT